MYKLPVHVIKLNSDLKNPILGFIKGMIVTNLICSGFMSCEMREDSFIGSEIENQRLELKTKVQTALSNDVDNLAFIFFTDPHLLGGIQSFSKNEKSRFESSFLELKEFYDFLPVSFCICGGDWLTFGDTQAQAKKKLLYADQKMKDLFPSYFKMMGNHDSNYQGVISIEDSSRGDLPYDFIFDVYFSEVGSSYYMFISNTTAFFILDSGLDWDIRMDDFKWTQIYWLAEELEEHKYEHVILGLHMVYELDKLTPMSEELVKLCDAYNHNGTYSSPVREFSFKSASGAIHTIISGHNHKDSISFVGANKDIPIIQTCNYTIDNTHSFDFCIVDYNVGSLDLYRIGKGDSKRQVKLAQSNHY